MTILAFNPRFCAKVEFPKNDPSIKQAKQMLKSLPDEPEVSEVQQTPEPPKPEPVPIKNIYTTTRRR